MKHVRPQKTDRMKAGVASN